MSGLEQNLDAYAVLADILCTIRERVNLALEDRYPSGWHREQALADIVDRLIARKEREKAIDWYSSEYQALIEFACFEDLLEILEKNDDLLPALKAVVPSPHLLHARMLELEALREKLAMARAVTENELSFLTTFHQRFRKALEGGESEPGGQAQRKPSRKKAVPEETPAPKSVEEVSGAEQAADLEEEPASTEPSKKSKKESEPQRSGKSAPAPPAAKASRQAAAAPEEVEAGAVPKTITTAIEAEDTPEILRYLYREVTAIADGLFSSANTPMPVYWKAVRGSAWYEKSFSRLGLKPLSDFYDIVDQAIERRENGASREEIQEFLKQHNFARILLSLRDMFQRNRL